MAGVQEQQVHQEPHAGNGAATAEGAHAGNGADTGNGSAAAGIPVENPATGAVIATVPDLGADAVAEMAARGREAQPQWEGIGFQARGRVLLRAQKWLMDNTERVIETIVSETGKTYEDAEFAEVAYAANAFGFWARNAPKYLADEHVKSSQLLVKGKKLILRRRPLGLVGVIGPWNYPLTNSFGDCIPALAAGNSVILKPSEVTPLTSLLMAQGLAECGLPEGVFQVATGRGETGAALTEQVDMIMFTGSTRTGRKVAESAARRLIPCSLELGGKDPMIVLCDADLERAANFAVYYSMQNAGQTCISIERAYVEAPIYDEFVSRVTSKVKALRVGAPSGPGSVDVGAITFPPQLETIADHVADAQPPDPRRRALLRADRAGRRRPQHEGDDRGDVRADAADHEGRRRRGGDPARQRVPLRARRLGVHEGRGTGRADRAPDPGRRGERQRRADQLHRPGAADGRREGLRAGEQARRRRHPQVLRAAGDRGDLEARPQARGPHVPLQGADHPPAAAVLQAALRARQARLTALRRVRVFATAALTPFVPTTAC